MDTSKNIYTSFNCDLTKLPLPTVVNILFGLQYYAFCLYEYNQERDSQ